MKTLAKELYAELMLVLRGKTLDLLLPPIVFYVAYSYLELNIALIIAIGFGGLLNLYRIIHKQKWWYAMFGMIGVLLASGFTFLSQNATDYFLFDMIGNVLVVIVVAFSLLIKRPVAAYASHITRGFPIPWLFRKDIYPAYWEVTVLWLAYLTLRGSIEIVLYLQGNLSGLVWFTTLAGIPMLLGVLIASYLYGLWRLRTLKGPSVDEFLAKKEPPYEGQKKGF